LSNPSFRYIQVPGEDPFLNGEYAMRWIHAFQYGLEGGAQVYKAMPSAKHAMAYDLENWGGLNRASFNALISERDQVEYYYPAWRAAVQGGRTGSVMCSYNAVNGVPSCANGEFLNGVLREQYGFDGLVVSDCGAIDHIHSQFKPSDPSTTGGNQSGVMKPGFPTNSSDATMLAGVSGGCDADCPGGNPPVTYFGGIANAIESGALPAELVDQSLTRVFTAAISLGLLDDPIKSPYAHLSEKDLDTPSTRKLNLEAAVQSMVLLKNDAVGGTPVLPIKRGAKLAIIGPHFNSTQDLLSDYSPGHWWARSPLVAAETMAKAGEVNVVGSAQGCDLEGNTTAGFAAAIALAKSADVPIVFVGLTPNNDVTNSGTPPVVGTASALESEGHDRTDIDLQGQQLPLIKALVAANPKTVVVLIHGGAIDISWCKDNVAAILDACATIACAFDLFACYLLNSHFLSQLAVHCDDCSLPTCVAPA
jgi:beta-glucosidase-like glycosyl hydrolase